MAKEENRVKDIFTALAWFVGFCLLLVVGHQAGWNVLNPAQGATTQIALAIAYATVIGTVLTLLFIGGAILWFRR